ncbi:endonuclease domain-containing protein [Candidatus Oscillochloris fontis]|uniref:endonuclease domain-containing protein n=1 Tax=Candidatus Oscillochloris fontis TaxID=2496868 RepID=UPI00101C18A2|nr:endonuclease domain-containing protein [Candidatus Oscillochloris fontis]
MSPQHRWRTTAPKQIRAQQLRQEQTEAETLLWAHLRNRGLAGYKFRRQHPISGYIVDFCCVERQVIVELDGPVHDSVAHSAADVERDAVLHAAGYRVIRFRNEQVFMDIHTVLTNLQVLLDCD